MTPGGNKISAAELLAQLQGGGASGGGGGDIDFGHYLRLLRQRLWLIITIVFLGTSLTLFLLQRQPRVYASTATILYDPEQSTIIDFEPTRSGMVQTREYINTIVDSFSSTKLLARTMRASELDKNPWFIAERQDGQEFNDLELANRLRSVVSATLKESTRVISVTAEDTDPNRARLIATTVVQEFIKQMNEQRDSVANFERDFLQREAERLKQELDESSQQLQAFREQHPGLSFSPDRDLTMDQLTNIGARVTNARSERLKLEAVLKSLREGDATSEAELARISTLVDLPQVAQIQAKLADANAQLGSLQSRYGPLHPKYAEVKEGRDELQRALSQALDKSVVILQQKYDAAVQTEKKIEAELREQENKALEQDRLKIRYNVLSREMEADNALHQDVMTRLKETTVRHGVRQIPFRIQELPPPPGPPIRPNVKRTLITGIGMSFFLALGLIIGFDLLFSKYRSIEEIENLLQLHPLAAVPLVPNTGNALMMRDNPNSLAGEAFRNIRAQILLQARTEPRRILLFTSANPGEGKSFISLNSAAAFALTGEKTLLIEADIRRPGIARQLPERYHTLPGLTDLLSGQATDADALIVEAEMPNLWFLPCGEPTMNPAELLSTPTMATLMKSVAGRFDRVVVDTAPINPVSDTLLICHHADAVCLVIESNKTPRGAVDRALAILKKAKISVAGFVLNRQLASVKKEYAPYYETLTRR